MLDTKSENISGEVALPGNEELELTTDELNAVAGGTPEIGKVGGLPQISTEMRIGNDVFSISANAKGYSVEHTHEGR